jgi:hypothetical protein
VRCGPAADEDLPAEYVRQLVSRIAEGSFDGSVYSFFESYNSVLQQRRIMASLIDDQARHKYAKDCMGDLFDEGPWASVRLTGLVGRPELNGRTGKVVDRATLDERGLVRFAVELDGEDGAATGARPLRINVLPANLAHPPDADE